MKAEWISSLPDEPISTENLNGHATSSLTSEEVKVDIESSKTQLEEQATRPVCNEDKTTGTCWITYCKAFVICNPW